MNPGSSIFRKRRRRAPSPRRPRYSNFPEDAITSRNHITYKDAGVDIDAGARLVEAVKPLARATARKGAEAALGGFGGLFDLKQAGFQDPVLVASTDGVGTKLTVAKQAGRHRGVGIDLVAMCVNDLVVQGAEPLFFLDYFATSALDIDQAREVIAGIAEGCQAAGCALIGGETAEMPGLYGPGDYDLAGFAVGAVERGRALSGAEISPGDVVLGLASSGVHANGFSLVRRLVAAAGLDYGETAPFDSDRGLGEALLAPTRIYVKSCLAALEAGGLHGLAHVTGGGLSENLPRVLPETCRAALNGQAWPLPPVFAWLAETSGLPEDELIRTFNCGIGMAAVVEAGAAETLTSVFREAGETVFPIGVIEARGAGESQFRLSAPVFP